MNLLIFLQLIILQIYQICASRGDQSRVFRTCVGKCHIKTCLDDETFLEPGDRSFYLNLLKWGCDDECKYECMWELINHFKSMDYPIPQFYGKWPFIRLLGIQEPASVLFSIFNFYVHLSCIHQFRKKVRHDSPMYWVWHALCGVSLNAWFWSAIFHTRDFPLTEFLDYSFAFSIILMNCYCMSIRVLYGRITRLLFLIITSSFIAFYLSHISYLSGPKFDYAYNMTVNLIVGGITAVSWFAWCLYNRYRLPYVWKAGLFFSLVSLSTLLEIVDRPPFLYVVDFHALWHLSSAPMTYIMYSFMTDDCQYLRKHMQYKDIENVAKED